MNSGREGRRSRRRTLHIPAWISLEQGALIPCQTWDIGQNGARLTFGQDDVPSIPDAFVLQFSPGGTPRRTCHVVWRDASQIGVKFVSPGQQPPPKPDKATPLDC